MTALLGAVASAGCQVHQVRAPEEIESPVTLPSAWSSPGGDAAVARWWTAFGDARLDALMARVEADNLTLREALARVDAARAAIGEADAGWWPSVDASVSASRQRSVVLGDARAFNLYTSQLAARYELDLWGRVASLTEAAEWEAEATRLDAQALGMTVAANVAEAWFTLVEQQALLALLTEHIEHNAELLDRLEQRYTAGIATAVAVSQQRQALAATRSLVPPVEAQIAVSRHRLAVLAGAAPASLAVEAGEALPTPPPLPATGVPGEVLRRRPDVAAVQFRAAAADARVAAALAERFPTFALSAAIGTGGPTPSALVEQWLYSLVASLAGPIFDGGRRAAAVERRRAEVRAAIADLGQTLLTAMSEVEDALARIDRGFARVEALEAERAVAHTLVEEAEARYTGGLSDYLPVVTAIRSAQAADRAVLSARRELLVQHVALYRALGGGLTPAAPPGRDEERR
ncbi:MAG: efflux transporter outer membrane subunit [Myxococcales bacterium]|nr:efflux transporter outer membrane subunit [Myxococcales bacterium]